MSAARVTSLYDLMDAAYDSREIHEHSRSLGHVPIIDANPRRDQARNDEIKREAKAGKKLGFKVPEKIRYNERSSVERVNGRLKEEFGASNIRVRGHAKVSCHLMFGVLALTADQLMRFVT